MSPGSFPELLHQVLAANQGWWVCPRQHNFCAPRWSPPIWSSHLALWARWAQLSLYWWSCLPTLLDISFIYNDMLNLLVIFFFKFWRLNLALEFFGWLSSSRRGYLNLEWYCSNEQIDEGGIVSVGLIIVGIRTPLILLCFFYGLCWGCIDHCMDYGEGILIEWKSISSSLRLTVLVLGVNLRYTLINYNTFKRTILWKYFVSETNDKKEKEKKRWNGDFNVSIELGTCQLSTLSQP